MRLDILLGLIEGEKENGQFSWYSLGKQTLDNKEVVMNSFHFYFVKNLLQKVMRGNAEGEKDLGL